MSSARNTEHKPERITLGTFIKTIGYRYRGVLVRANVRSAAWRRRWWIEDCGNHGWPVRRALLLAAGVNPQDCTSWTPVVSFPSLQAACAAIATATGAAQ